MKLLGILLLTLSFTNCKSHKFEQNPPFIVHSATYVHVTGGVPGSQSLNLMIEFTSEKAIEFETVYFQGRSIKPVVEQKVNKQYLAARYNTSPEKGKHDLVLHSDSKKEYGNKPTSKEEEPTFNLKENEAIISYKINGKSHFYKLKNIAKEESVFMPSANPRSNQ
ncbi:conserved protein of unknown function [Tenacibaculum sp. 190130A14a]|uniref:Lipoprotein n=2 Tax=Tenacibaculum polynesiense TaxID=3137857 RepID=A0ABM9PA15_9FLAO